MQGQNCLEWIRNASVPDIDGHVYFKMVNYGVVCFEKYLKRDIKESTKSPTSKNQVVRARGLSYPPYETSGRKASET